MFCTRCGEKNEDGAKFCVKCGNKLEGAAPKNKSITPENYVKYQPGTSFIKENSKQSEPEKKNNILKPKRKIKILPIILFIVLLAAVIAFPKFILSGNAEKKIAQNFVASIMTGDADKLMEFVPDKIISAVEEEEGVSEAQITQMLADEMSTVQDKLNETLGEGWKYSCKVNSIEPVEEDRLNDIIDNYSELEVDMGITEATVVGVEVSVSGNDIDNNATLDLPLIKIDGNWYLDFYSIISGDVDWSSLL